MVVGVMGAFLCLCFLGTNFWELFDPVICCVVITLCLPGFDLLCYSWGYRLVPWVLFNKLISGNLPYDWKQKRKKVIKLVRNQWYWLVELRHLVSPNYPYVQATQGLKISSSFQLRIITAFLLDDTVWLDTQILPETTNCVHEFNEIAGDSILLTSKFFIGRSWCAGLVVALSICVWYPSWASMPPLGSWFHFPELMELDCCCKWHNAILSIPLNQTHGSF